MGSNKNPWDFRQFVRALRGSLGCFFEGKGSLALMEYPPDFQKEMHLRILRVHFLLLYYPSLKLTAILPLKIGRNPK